MENNNLKSNGYGILRLLFAMSVVYSHSYALAGSSDIDLVQRVTGVSCSHFGVMGFFVLSGFLNAQSLSRGGERQWIAGKFLVRRAFRIFPLLWTMLLIVMVAYVIYAATGGLDQLASNHDLPHKKIVHSAWKAARSFFRGNAIPWLPHYALPGVFEKNPNIAVCGSLWTLPYEVLFYLILSLAPLVRRAGNGAVVSLMLVFAVASVVATSASPAAMPVFASFQTYWFGTLGFAFMVGVMLNYVPTGKPGTVVSVIVLFIYFKYQMFTYGAVEILCFGIIITNLGAIPLGRISRLSERWDPSYGIYLLSFPIQQILVSHGCRSPAALLALSTVISLVCACLTWQFVERPMLGIGRRLTRSANPVGHGSPNDLAGAC